MPDLSGFHAFTNWQHWRHECNYTKFVRKPDENVASSPKRAARKLLLDAKKHEALGTPSTLGVCSHCLSDLIEFAFFTAIPTRPQGNSQAASVHAKTSRWSSN
ncbi:uncharacterized protein LOC112493873 [Cephus cinctus]|uniref:Uncharacterized protein LOC112493873 n=1 Tax=Cephus cinctus TaxID=211228 RepID=A0AAJ7RAT9_CEPCN|nr:uncharacterized protein LOC112493873 [Cephus cinctus]